MKNRDMLTVKNHSTQAPNRLNSDTLVDLLYLLGYTEGEVEQLIKE